MQALGVKAFESAIKTAVSSSTVAGAAVAAVYRTAQGYQRYEKGFGKESIEDTARDASPTDSLFWTFSCTKILTSISALQLVERGLITLDEPLDDVLTEFRRPIAVFTGKYDTDGAPEQTTTDRPLTLRRLLTHTSGFVYDFTSPALQAWRSRLPTDDPRAVIDYKAQSVANHNDKPLAFAPGTDFQYGSSHDWIGKVIERVNGEGLSLGGFMAKYIFGPLGMKSTTFRPGRDPILKEKRIPIYARDPATKKLVPASPAVPISLTFAHNDEPVDDTGGGPGVYSTVEDFARVLESLLRDDGKLLSPATAAGLFAPQLPEQGGGPEIPGLQTKLAMTRGLIAQPSTLGATSVAASAAAGQEGPKLNCGLGGFLTVDALPGLTGPGCLEWCGGMNTFWWIDRAGGTAGCYGSQLASGFDTATVELYWQFRKGVFDLADGTS